MLRNVTLSHQGPRPEDLNAPKNLEVDKILSFLDQCISGFSLYYMQVKDSDKENRISDILVHHLQLCKIEEGGYLPFDFRKNPTQVASDKETDIGVFVMTRSIKPLPILEFEAKRFSATSKYKEYVSGIRGGIERFKRGHHSSHLTVCGMFGYVQSDTSDRWIQKVNAWLQDLALNNIDTSIDWSNSDELLLPVASFNSVQKLTSTTFRNSPLEKLLLWHYFIDLN